MLDKFLERAPYSLTQKEKDEWLLAGLNNLTDYHYNHCDAYAAIIKGAWENKKRASTLAKIPYLPVSLFKKQFMSSINRDDVTTVLTSSGTTGQQVSKIPIDKETSLRQVQALTHSIGHIIGKKRLPMLVIDSSAVVKDPTLMSARGAGVLGMMRFGYRPVFALDENMQPDLGTVRDFLDNSGDKPFMLFGFTFMVWEHLYGQFKGEKLDFSNGILIHSGGWKKMIEQSVDNMTFRQKLCEEFGLNKISNFYGMVEQIGSIFLEGADGLLYPPSFAEVIIRNTKTWNECEIGQEGLVQVLSMIPKSYPGHSVITEDLGVVENISDGGNYMGKGIRIIGRVKKAELRGCSDVIAEAS